VDSEGVEHPQLVRAPVHHDDAASLKVVASVALGVSALSSDGSSGWQVTVATMNAKAIRWFMLRSS